MKSDSLPQQIANEAEILDVLSLFADANPSINGIAKKLSISKQRVVSRLHEAFTTGVVDFPLFPGSPYGNSLGNLFGGVKFRVINAKHEFDVLASLQILAWLRDIIGELPRFDELDWDQAGISNRYESQLPFVQIGGGEAVHDLVRATSRALNSPSLPELNPWFLSEEPRCCIVNATAGGQPWKPQFESSLVACELASLISQKSALFSLSSSPSEDEKCLIECAIKNSVAIVTGIGDRDGAYCVKAMADAGYLPDDVREQLMGEFCFHLFDRSGKRLSVEGIETKEQTFQNNWIVEKSHVLSRLLDFQSLVGRPAKNLYRTDKGGNPLPRYVIGVANSNSTNRLSKAKSIHTLLRCGLLTHLCLPAQLAQTVISIGHQPEK